MRVGGALAAARESASAHEVERRMSDRQPSRLLSATRSLFRRDERRDPPFRAAGIGAIDVLVQFPDGVTRLARMERAPTVGKQLNADGIPREWVVEAVDAVDDKTYRFEVTVRHERRRGGEL